MVKEIAGCAEKDRWRRGAVFRPAISGGNSTAETAARPAATEPGITLAQLVDWAERALMDGKFAEHDVATLSQIVARLGVADVRAFGLAWDDCDELLRKLGFVPRVEVVAA